jgi:hypothetical protein
MEEREREGGRREERFREGGKERYVGKEDER